MIGGNHRRIPLVPAIVLLFTWILTPLLLVDRGVNVAEALPLSNNYTYRNKFACFLAGTVLLISFSIICCILHLVFSPPGIIFAVLMGAVLGMSFIATLYKQLVLSKEQEA